MKFRPFPGLTLFTLISLGILLFLGTWQYQRLGWKTDYIARIDAAADSPAFTSADDITTASAAGEPVDYRRVKLSGTYHQISGQDKKAIEFHVFKSQDGKTNWRIFRPLKSVSGHEVFVAGELVSDGSKDLPRLISTETVFVSGYVRTWQAPSRFVAKSTPSANRWFSFNALRSTDPWEDILAPANINGNFYIDAAQTSGAPIAEDLPVKKPDIPNNHFDYMMTWYSFALILLIIYFILHIRAGRLRFGV